MLTLGGLRWRSGGPAGVDGSLPLSQREVHSGRVADGPTPLAV